MMPSAISFKGTVDDEQQESCLEAHFVPLQYGCTAPALPTVPGLSNTLLRDCDISTTNLSLSEPGHTNHLKGSHIHTPGHTILRPCYTS